jgi:uncharacterized membrane protein
VYDPPTSRVPVEGPPAALLLADNPGMDPDTSLALPALSLLALGVLAGLARDADWRGLVAGGRLDVWLGASGVLMVLWRMRAGAQMGLDLHLAGATVAYLMFGLRLAGVALALAAAGSAVAAGRPWLGIGSEWLAQGVVPLLASAILIPIAERRLPANPFVFLWGYGFLVSGLAVMVGGMVQTALYAGLGTMSWQRLQEEVLPFFFLLGWSEAFTAGALLTLMVVYRPGWVARFDDTRYLRRR